MLVYCRCMRTSFKIILYEAVQKSIYRQGLLCCLSAGCIPIDIMLSTSLSEGQTASQITSVASISAVADRLIALDKDLP